MEDEILHHASLIASQPVSYTHLDVYKRQLQAALDACFGFNPHLLVLDIGLPDGDGFNIVDWLRNNASLAHLPLVVYSGREFSPAERRQLTLGPTHFLTKARVQPQQLEALVLTCLLYTSRCV